MTGTFTLTTPKGNIVMATGWTRPNLADSRPGVDDHHQGHQALQGNRRQRIGLDSIWTVNPEAPGSVKSSGKFTLTVQLEGHDADQMNANEALSSNCGPSAR